MMGNQQKTFSTFGYHGYYPQMNHSMEFTDQKYSSQFHYQHQNNSGFYEMMPQKGNEFYHQNQIKKNFLEEEIKPINKAFSFTE